MKATLIDLFTSKKFLAALAACIIYVAGRFGFDVDPAALDRIFAALLVYVGAQGVADVGKGAAEVHASQFAGLGKPSGLESGAAKVTPPPSTSTAGLTILAVLLFCGVATQLAACAETKAVPPAALHAIEDCSKQDAGPILTSVLKLAADAAESLLKVAGINWDADEAAAEAAGTAAADCAFVEFWAALNPTPAPSSAASTARALVATVNPATAALERLRAHAGGVRWRLPDGTLR